MKQTNCGLTAEKGRVAFVFAAVALSWVAAFLAAGQLEAAVYSVCQSGCTYSDLQQALDAAEDGDVLELVAGETFTGNFRMSKRHAVPVTVRSSRWGELPAAGFRASKEHAALMPKIVTPNTNPAISFVHTINWSMAQGSDTIQAPAGHGFAEGDAAVWSFMLPNADGTYGNSRYTLPRPFRPDGTVYYAVGVTPTTFKLAAEPGGEPITATSAGNGWQDGVLPGWGSSGWVLQGLEITLDAEGVYNLVLLGQSGETTVEATPQNIEIDRCYIHGWENDGTPKSNGPRRCIALNSRSTIIRNSTIAECHTREVDSQAIAGWNTPGPILIENNYLEGAGENTILGGSPAGIQNSQHCKHGGCTFRSNHYYKPLTWKYGSGPAAPQGACLNEEYYEVAHRVTALDGSTHAITLAEPHGWSIGEPIRVINNYPFTGIDTKGYTIYYVESVPAPDQVTLSASPGGPVLPLSGTADPRNALVSNNEHYACAEGTWAPTPVTRHRYMIKNLFELKSADGVTVDGNIFENNWVHGQSGHGILMNQVDNFQASWSAMENVLFTNNIYRNAPNGWSMNSYGYGGYIYGTPTHHVTVRNNLMYNTDNPLYGTTAGDAFLTKEVQYLTMEHNTFVSGTRTGLYLTGRSGMTSGFRYRDNIQLAKGYQLATLSTYDCKGLLMQAPDMMMSNNAFIGATPNKYLQCSPDTHFPATVSEVGFANPDGHDFSLRPESPLRNAASDGTDIGADMEAIRDAVSGVLEGTPRWSTLARLQVQTGSDKAAFTFSTAPGEEAATIAISTSRNMSNAAEQSGAAPLVFEAQPGMRYYYRYQSGPWVIKGEFQTMEAGGGEYGFTLSFPESRTVWYSKAADCSNPVSATGATVRIAVPSRTLVYGCGGGFTGVLVAP